MSSDDFDSFPGLILSNLLQFGRLLRISGFPISSSRILELVEGLAYIDISNRGDFYNTSRAFLLCDYQKSRLFDLAFDLFWNQLITARSDSVKVPRNYSLISHEDDSLEGIHNPLFKDRGVNSAEGNQLAHSPDGIEPLRVFSPDEVLYRKDFSDYGADDFERARVFIQQIVWKLKQKKSRRRIKSVKQSSYLDFPVTFRNNMRYGGEFVEFYWKRRKMKPRPVTVICDISGSMESYSRIFLHFVYGLVQNSNQVDAFVFGTRLTRLTQALRKNSVKDVLAGLSGLIQDWSGGTRIGESIRTFNYQWSRRTLGHDSIVILISDGWDRGDVVLLRREIRRLSESVYKLIWLNPLSGSADYQPLVQGMQAVLPFIDIFLPLNNLANLEQVARRVASVADSREESWGSGKRGSLSSRQIR